MCAPTPSLRPLTLCFYPSVVFPVVYVVISEIFPMGVRGRAASVVAAVSWATHLLISMTFLTVTGVSSYISGL